MWTSTEHDVGQLARSDKGQNFGDWNLPSLIDWDAVYPIQVNWLSWFKIFSLTADSPSVRENAFCPFSLSALPLQCILPRMDVIVTDPQERGRAFLLVGKTRVAFDPWHTWQSTMGCTESALSGASLQGSLDKQAWWLVIASRLSQLAAVAALITLTLSYICEYWPNRKNHHWQRCVLCVRKKTLCEGGIIAEQENFFNYSLTVRFQTCIVWLSGFRHATWGCLTTLKPR